MGGSKVWPFEVQQVYAQEPPTEFAALEVQSTEAPMPVHVDLGGITIMMGFWALAIIFGVELVKRVWLTATLKKGSRYRRIVPALPLLAGVASGGALGPVVMSQMSLIVSPLLGAILVGPVAGGAAMVSFIGIKRWLLPAAIKAAPAVARAAILRASLLVGLELNEKDLPELEQPTDFAAGLEEVSEVSEEEPLGSIWPLLLLLAFTVAAVIFSAFGLG